MKISADRKHKKEPKGNSVSEKYNNWNEEYTRGFQKWIWAVRKKNQHKKTEEK